MRTLITLTGIFDEPIKNADGSWSFEIASHPIDETQHKVLDELFPDLESGVIKLLNKQAVLNSIR